MNSPRTRRQALPLLAIGQWALSLAVLLWGTSYKVSLYPVPGQTPGGMPHAKLLSEKERPNDIRRLNLGVTPPRLAIALLLSAALILSRVAGELFSPVWLARTLQSNRTQLRRASALNYFFFRPPPAPASSPSLS